jgi:hypothetical protein
MPEHKDITDPQIHEPKGVASAAAGQIYVADGAGSGSWTNQQVIADRAVHGWWDYNDLATATTPIPLTSGVAAEFYRTCVR